MSDTESGRPRRALEPLDDDLQNQEGTDGAASATSPSRAWVAADNTDDTTKAADGPVVEPEVTTPIPPPAPTLPEPLQPPGAGRRFSAEPVAEDWVSGAPRRSAASVSSPPAVDEPAPPSQDALDPAEAQAAVVEPDGAKGHPRRRLWTIVGAAVAAVLVVGLIAWLSTQHAGTTATPSPSSASPTPTESPSPSAPVSAAELVTAADLAKVRKSTTWTAVEATPTGSQPACLELSSAGGPVPQAEASAHYTANKDGGTLVQVAQALADTQSASTVYDGLLAQAAACNDALVLNAYRVEGLADATSALTVQLNDNSRHTLLLTRTGRFVNVIDAAVNAGDPVDVTALSKALADSLTKQCGTATGTCPSSVKTAATTPPATPTLGWLAFVDLPQITAGQGTWTATDPKAPDLQGSECENVNLNKLPGSTAAGHRIYLLTDDQKAPDGFGIDEAVYTFAKPAQAAAMAKTLDTNFGSCGARTRTATVTDEAVTAVGADGKALAATAYVVTQRVSDSKTVTFRVAVAAVGNRLVYLMANPSSGFDFTSAEWTTLVGRAAQRATQFG